jgi:hypothetical protein
MTLSTMITVTLNIQCCSVECRVCCLLTFYRYAECHCHECHYTECCDFLQTESRLKQSQYCKQSGPEHVFIILTDLVCYLQLLMNIL